MGKNAVLGVNVFVAQMRIDEMYANEEFLAAINI